MANSSGMAASAVGSVEAAVIREASHARRLASVRRFCDRVLVLVLLLGVWEGVVRVGWVHPFFISQPSAIVQDIYTLFASGYIWPHLAITFYETIVGLLLGTVLGMSMGFGAALSTRFADAIQPVIVAFSSMPRVAIAPLFIIWFGFGADSKIALATSVVFFIVFFNTFSGLRAIEPVLLNNIRSMGGSELHVLRFVSAPYTLAWVFAATKTSISMALISAVVGEFVGSTSGLGWIMVQASGTLDTTRLFAIMTILAIFGSAIFSAVRMLEDRVLKWRPSQEG